MKSKYLHNRSFDALFPCLLFTSQLADLSLCKNLKKVIKTSMSIDNIEHNDSIKELYSIIMEESRNILDYLHVVRDSHYVSEMWSSVASDQIGHVHSNSILSGVFYISATEKSAPIAFTDPRPSFLMLQPDYSERNVFNGGRAAFVPKAGQFMFWNSALTHSVEGEDEEVLADRISISFNIKIVGTCTAYTMKHKFL